jgi:hypothetical protein
MQIFESIEDYLNSRKVGGTQSGQRIIPNDTQRELFITSHESLRLGEAAYLLLYLNMLKKSNQPSQRSNIPGQIQSSIPEFSMILTDPYLGNSDFLNNILMKPF